MPGIADLSNEELMAMANEKPDISSLSNEDLLKLSGQQPKNPAFLPNYNKILSEQNTRPDSVQSLTQELSTRWNPLKNPFKAALQPAAIALKAAAIPFQRAEAGVANVGMEAQRGNLTPGSFFSAAAKGISGERQGQLGDLIRTTGFGEKVPMLGFKNLNEGLANVAGGAGSIPLFSGVASGLAKSGQAAGKISKLGFRGALNSGEAIKNIPNKFFRGGITKPEAIRIEEQYGSSNGSLVDIVKNRLNQKIDLADKAYGDVFAKYPENKTINVRPAIEEAGNRLKRLGLITKNGNLTQLGESEIARDSVYGKLLDFYKSADSISGVKDLRGQPLTNPQMIKLMKSENETLVNKDQFLFLRDKLNSLYKGKPSDIDVSKVADSFYQSGENSGLKGLQSARRLEKEAFNKADKFLNSKTGDLKIATESKLNRIGTDKPLSQQEMKHIKDLENYVNHPITSEADKINKLNKAKDRIKNIKKYGKASAATVVVGEIGRKVVSGRF